jgi:hypothetical protein
MVLSVCDFGWSLSRGGRRVGILHNVAEHMIWIPNKWIEGYEYLGIRPFLIDKLSSTQPKIGVCIAP